MMWEIWTGASGQLYEDFGPIYITETGLKMVDIHGRRYRRLLVGDRDFSAPTIDISTHTLFVAILSYPGFT